jgi:hypothetical protein
VIAGSQRERLCHTAKVRGCPLRPRLSFYELSAWRKFSKEEKRVVLKSINIRDFETAFAAGNRLGRDLHQLLDPVVSLI